jgi:osmotically-inducible protein OsmY
MKTESQLRHDVMAELEWDPIVDHADIGVAVIDGVVTLTGFVKSLAEKQAAERAARRVYGVKAIAEEIKVRYASDPKNADHEIARRILDVFQWSALIPSKKLAVKVENGWVTLTGTVEWHFEADEAEQAAGRISGVVGIINENQGATSGDGERYASPDRKRLQAPSGPRRGDGRAGGQQGHSRRQGEGLARTPSGRMRRLGSAWRNPGHRPHRHRLNVHVAI